MRTATNLLQFPSDAAAPPAPDPLAELIAERARIGTELARFSPVAQRRAAAEAAVATCEAAISALDAATAAEWTRWGQCPDGGEPAPRHEERRALVARLAAAASNLEGAKIAEAGVAPRQLGLMSELRAIEGKIRVIRLARVVEAATALHREGERLALASGDPLMSIAGLRAALVQQATSAGSRRDEAAQHDFLHAIAEVDKLPPLRVTGDPATIAKQAREWTGALS